MHFELQYSCWRRREAVRILSIPSCQKMSQDTMVWAVPLEFWVNHFYLITLVALGCGRQCCMCVFYGNIGFLYQWHELTCFVGHLIHWISQKQTSHLVILPINAFSIYFPWETTHTVLLVTLWLKCVPFNCNVSVWFGHFIELSLFTHIPLSIHI